MIDVTNDIAKQKIRTEFIRIMARLERGFTLDIKTVLNNQYKKAAKTIESGDMDINFIIDIFGKKLIGIFDSQYRKTATTFSKKAYEEVDSFVKTPLDIFWLTMNNWIKIEALNKSKIVNKTTKKILRTVILKGMNAGMTHLEIAEKIKKMGKISSLSRARMIARTETHTAATKSVNEAMKSTKILKEKEWLSALDERTRTGLFDHAYANGERVGIDEMFIRTGESLRYPGDSSGSAGNIVNCRCISLYHSIKKPIIT